MCFMHRRSLITPAIVAAVISCTILGGVARSPAPSAANCNDAFLNLTGCLSYTAVGSNDTAPSGDCCPELAGLIDSNPICLCELLAGGAESLGIAVDNARALRLPSLCRLDAPPVSLCSDVGIPVASPITATLPAPATPTPAGSLAPSAAGNGGQESPESTPASNGQKKLAGGDGTAELVKAAALSFIATAAAAII
ncbi:non-specific lipid transfer protein GPI-anchored 12-like [Curcuma longa]|uniref:non-specific lipid transfer protein GPI-anchored 12-like n=1 Tax=Curcuma longa TaxID=136217 RepID=UPI003D9DCD50